MPQEFEAKFLKIDPEKLREKLKERAFELVEPEHLMVRVSFEIPRVSGLKKWVRIRKEKDKVTITLKEKKGEGLGGIEEIEVEVDDFEKGLQLLQGLGLVNPSRYENKREKWKRDRVEVTIDTWPGIKPFCEIEAETKEEVERVAEELGFDMKEAVFGSVADLYSLLLGVPAQKIIDLPEITFQNPPQNQLFKHG